MRLRVPSQQRSWRHCELRSALLHATFRAWRMRRRAENRRDGNRLRRAGQSRGVTVTNARPEPTAETARRAFADAYERHCHAVYNHCFRRSGSWAAAEELMAVSFLEAWRRWSSAPADPAGTLPWLLAVTNNVLRNTRRSDRRYAAALARLPRRDASPDLAADVAAKVDAERRMATLLPALRSLPRREREVIELCIGDGLTHTEAAKTLSIPAGTVKSRLSRGLTRLRATGAITSPDTPPRQAI
jgi:RNA polymerase sigma factor (sigma-70 family)